MNPMATVLYVLGGVTILTSVIVGANDASIAESFIAFMMWFVPGLVAGVMLMGFGEVIKQLDEQKKVLKTAYGIKDPVETQEATEEPVTEDTDPLDKFEEMKESWKKYQ